MPINRPDGRHWCDPASEEPGEDGTWTCPDDGRIWIREETERGLLWSEVVEGSET